MEAMELELEYDDDQQFQDDPWVSTEEQPILEIGDLDVFFTSFYRFHTARGLVGVVFKQAMGVFSLAFTVGFSAFLIGFVKWRNLLENCGGEGECGEIAGYVITKPFVAYADSPLQLLLILLYIAVFSSYTIWRAWHAWRICTDAFLMSRFCETVLLITVEQLQCMSWEQLLRALAKAEERGACTLSDRMGESGLELEASLRLMRSENYLIAMVSGASLLPLLHATFFLHVHTHTHTYSHSPPLLPLPHSQVGYWAHP